MMRPAPIPAPIPALLALSLVATAAPAYAETLDAAAARDQLYRADRVEVLRYDMRGLSEQEVATITALAQTQKYYAAMAFAPDAGIMAEPTVLASNYHSPEAAREAAMRDCNARRDGGTPCALAIEVRPAGFEPRDLTLSADATTAFDDDYRRARGTRAFAISAASGQWGIGRGDSAADDAIAACRGDSDVSDCSVVIAD